MSQDGIFYWGVTAQYPNGHLIKVSSDNPLPTTGGGSGSSTNLTQVSGDPITLGQDTSGTGANSLPAVLASGTSIAVSGSVTASGSVALLAGTAIAGKFGIDQTTDGTTNAVHLVAGTAVAGKFGIDQTTLGTTNAVQNIPGTTGGLTLKSNIIAANTTAIVVKASAGQVYKVEAFTLGSSSEVVVIHWYDATSATAGSGTPVWRTVIPAPPAGGGGYVTDTPSGLAFSTGITYIVTTGLTDADTGTPTANVHVVNVGYK